MYYKNIFSLKFKLVVAITATNILIFQPSLKAVKLADGTVAFNRGPDLVNVMTTFSQARAWGAKYYFTLQVAPDSDEPLGKIIIQQRQGQETIKFTLNDTLAFKGNHRQKGEKIPLANVELTEDNSITIVFETPISPGTLLTVGLIPQENPQNGGVYLFGVTAFPAGEKAQGLYLGVGRLHFYDNSDGNLF